MFPKKTHHGTKKTVSFSDLKSDLDITLKVQDEHQDYQLKVHLNGTVGLEENMKDKNITAWNGYVEFELDRLGVPKIGESFIIVNETITEKYNTTKKVLKN